MRFLQEFDKFANKSNNLKRFESYKVNEDAPTQEQPADLGNFMTTYTRKVSKTINTKEVIIDTTKVKEIKPYTLSKRGPELINQAVMAKGENPDSLDINIDSEKLEYAWRMIAKDVNGALTATKIEKDGKVVAFNIKKDDKNNVTFDFTFENKDSTQNTDPSGKTTKNMLAGQLVGGEIILDHLQEPQVWIVLNAIKADMNLNTITNKTELLNKKFQLIEAGYIQIAGTYNFHLPTKGEWVTYTQNDNSLIVKFFAENKGSYFDVKDLYTKFGIDPNTKQSTGKANWELQIKN